MENILGTNLDRIVILAYFAVVMGFGAYFGKYSNCLLYTSPSPRDRSLSRMPSSA